MKAKEMREKSSEELEKMLKDFQLELIKLGDTNIGRKRVLRKMIARVKTILRERKK